MTAEVAENYAGHFQLHLCQLRGDDDSETEDCFDANLLKFENNEKKYHFVNRFAGNYTTRVVLPQGLTCERCVLRWQYISGNLKGKCDYNVIDYGCGQQETFRTCSDIRIVA